MEICSRKRMLRTITTFLKFLTQDQHLPEKALQDKHSPMEAVKVIPLEKTSQELTKELDDLKLRYKNLASQHAKDVYELEEMRTRLQYLLQQEFVLDQRISELQLKRMKE
ncbi:hypothetical protein DAPPUDRAFT_332820 [Daphnia pulex]|uniref:Uncharacterized protein n=1 Tax=Daphnia pulex TaxID=6669 RepID=E9HR18_DAPPU|nr:hypothetical protein DAPPUDRAFT_332820 [Daphnia pulex]|eukprot:EFX65792.1 hypothetical protein DAPPUDRAFT_332820 [Daphnia pulex]